MRLFDLSAMLVLTSVAAAIGWEGRAGADETGPASMLVDEANNQPTPGSAGGGVYNPRSRLYFQGHFTKPIQYTLSVQNTFDAVGLTDAYLNFNYDPRFQVRFGRFKTPFTYEFYRVHVWDLLAPERSLFANNYEANRLKGSSEERLAYLKRVQLAHPEDFWVNLRSAVVCHQLLN